MINYINIVNNKAKEIIKECLDAVIKNGLKENQHFFIMFKTSAPGVILSDDLLQKFPEDMMIAIQHQFGNLRVTDKGFGITLFFDGVSEDMFISYNSVIGFYDPEYSFNIELKDDESVIMCTSRPLSDSSNDDIIISSIDRGDILDDDGRDGHDPIIVDEDEFIKARNEQE